MRICTGFDACTLELLLKFRRIGCCGDAYVDMHMDSFTIVDR